MLDRRRSMLGFTYKFIRHVRIKRNLLAVATKDNFRTISISVWYDKRISKGEKKKRLTGKKRRNIQPKTSNNQNKTKTKIKQDEQIQIAEVQCNSQSYSSSSHSNSSTKQPTNQRAPIRAYGFEIKFITICRFTYQLFSPTRHILFNFFAVTNHEHPP